MEDPGDIPIISAERPAFSPSDRADLVWLVDGREVDFDEGADARPWLEQSIEWGSGQARSTDDSAPDSLIWL